MIGTTIGKYRFVGLLGRGATGIVYRAVDETLEREVAIKILSPHVAAGDILKRFRAEATILARLSHPEIATIHELLRTDTDLLMVMELVRGETLEQLANRVGPMSPDVTARLIDGILSALDHAHRAGIVHRDLKPANVMVTKLGGIKIMDFGIARVRGAEHMTIDGCAVGTPAYMPPEQVLGEEIDGRADLYAVGVILYRLLTGRLPFDAETPMAMLQKQIAETPAPLQVHRQGLPEWCEGVVERALAKVPADRFQTAEEFRIAVGRAAGLIPSLDLAKALAIVSDEAGSRPLESPAHETLAISPTQERAHETAPVAGRSDREGGTLLLPDVEPGKLQAARRPVTAHAAFILAKSFARTRDGAAIIGGVAAALGLVAYLAGSAFAVNPDGRGKTSASATVDRGALRSSERSEPLTARTPGAAASRTAAPPAAREDSSSEAPSPIAFRTKIVRAPDGRARDEDARLSFAGNRLVVATYTAPDDPVFSVPYKDITAIEHSRQAGWKPPEKWSKVIRVEDDVLDAFGIRGRHYVSLYTRSEDQFVVLRVDERAVNRLLKALKQHTGKDPERVAR